jgi:hypothetical protein
VTRASPFDDVGEILGATEHRAADSTPAAGRERICIQEPDWPQTESRVLGQAAGKMLADVPRPND